MADLEKNKTGSSAANFIDIVEVVAEKHCKLILLTKTDLLRSDVRY